VNSGLILKADTEAELASAMAHEIAHVAARHGTRQASRGQLVNMASVPLIFLGGWAGFAIRQGASVAIPVTFLKFSRSFEREADLLGLQYLYKTGYDPTAFVDFFERMEAMEKRKPGTVSGLFRSHPNIAVRIEFTQNNIQQLLVSRPEYVVTTSEFQETKQQLTIAANARRAIPEKSGPTLRKPGEREDGSRDSKPDEDERPTLRRRDG
jgi:predicted Zn-dependent protease